MKYFIILFNVWAMMLGYRTIEISNGFLLHPLDISLWVYFMLRLIENKSIFKTVPLEILIFLFLALLSLMNNVYYSNTVFSDLKVLFLLIPVFILVSDLVNNRHLLKKVMYNFLLVSLLLSILGIFEYHFPRIAVNISFFTNPESIFSYGGFYRAQFSFFGNPIATIIPLFSLGFIFYFNPFFNKYLYFIIIVILLYAVYIGGYRSFWSTFLISFFINIFLSKKIKTFILLAFLFSTIFILTGLSFSSAASSRFLSAFSSLQGKSELGETSGEKRIRMIDEIFNWNILSENFLGHGLSTAGWVHSDLLMIAYNSGLISAIILVIFILRVIYNLISDFDYSNKYLISLLSIVPIILMILLFQTFITRTQLAVPFYFFLALMYYYPRRKVPKKVKSLQYS